MLPQRVESRRRLDDSLQLKGSTSDFNCGSLTKRRDTIHVIQDILSLGKEGVSRTQVIQKANLSFSLAMRYIPFLLSKGHLEQGIDGRGIRKYLLTTKGQRLLGCIAEIQKELDEPITARRIIQIPPSRQGLKLVGLHITT